MTMLNPKGLEAAAYAVRDDIWQAESDIDVELSLQVLRQEAVEKAVAVVSAYLSTVTPAEVGGLVERLNTMADIIEMGERIAWGSDTAIMREAATALASERAAHAETKRELEAAIEAMTPSAETKSDYIGEFCFFIDIDRGSACEVTHRVAVPWATIKEIMAAISSRAARRVREGGKADG